MLNICTLGKIGGRTGPGVDGVWRKINYSPLPLLPNSKTRKIKPN